MEAGMKSFAETRKVFFLLGRACNFKCRYCLQCKEDPVSFPKRVSEEAVAFLQKLADAQPRTQRQRASLRINLMGGEPLLYFPTIQDLVKRVDRSNVEWAFATNGSLISPTMVDFFNEHRVKVILSHDGPQTVKTRGIDVLANPDIKACLQALDRFSVDSVITSYSQNLLAVRAYINEAMGCAVPLKHVFLTLLNEVPADLLDYDLAAWKATCAQMGDVALVQFEAKRTGWESDWFWRYINRYYDFAEGTNPLCSCSTRGKTLTVDGNGRVWRCINGVYPIGTVGAECRDFNQRSEANIIRLYQDNKHDCGECRWFPLCHGHCPRERMTAQQRIQCEFMGIFFEAVATVMQQFCQFRQDNENSGDEFPESKAAEGVLK